MAEPVTVEGAALNEAEAAVLPPVVDLPFYDPAKLLVERPDVSVLLTGNTGSGKSVYEKYIMYTLRKVLDFAVLMCPSADVRKEFREFLPSSMVQDFDKDKLNAIVAAQVQLAEETVNDPTQLRRIGIVCDDCAFNRQAMNSSVFRALTMNGRHNKFFFMVCTQHLADFPKALRANLGVIISFAPRTTAEFNTLYDHIWEGVFESKEDCQAAFNSLGEFECLVFDAKRQQLRQPYVFYSKAPGTLPRFRVGSDAYWITHYTYFKRAQNRTIAIASAVAAAKGLKVITTERGAAAAAPKTSKVVIKRGPMPPGLVPCVSGPGPAGEPGHAFAGHQHPALAYEETSTFHRAAAIGAEVAVAAAAASKRAGGHGGGGAHGAGRSAGKKRRFGIAAGGPFGGGGGGAALRRRETLLPLPSSAGGLVVPQSIPPMPPML